MAPWRGWLRATAVGFIAFGSMGIAPQVANADDQVTVMSRNIYLGADVAGALALIPDLPSAAQYMWDQVAATDFDSRAPILARELSTLRPDVVAIQEATQWQCRASILGSNTVVFDFTEQLLAETQAQGVPYVIASHDGQQAYNPGYFIPVLPRLTEVTDPETFQPLFGADTAACGFTIADALLVRADIADQIRRVGTIDYDEKYAVVPVLFEIPRGLAWADIQFGDTTARFVTTHLESLWDPGVVPVTATQAKQLVSLTGDWQMPLIVAGDFNADPRDPRAAGAPNPAGQPDTTTGCAAQPTAGLPAAAIADCNAYWTMVEAGFLDVGPDALDPANATWGMSALLAGPDLERLADGNQYGFTDRLDYLFVRNGVDVVGVEFVGQTWPTGDSLWACEDPAQAANAQQAASALGVSVGDAVCLATDHVGLVATLQLPESSAVESFPTTDQRGIPWAWVAAVVLLVGAAIVVVSVIRRR